MEENIITDKKERFVIRLDWHTLDREELREYINDLHRYLMDFSTSSIHDILIELDNVARVIAEDLALIAQGNGIRAKFLTESKDDKQYERVMAMVDKATKWQAISDMAKSLRPDAVELNIKQLTDGETPSKKKARLEAGVNAFEFAQEQAMKGKK